MSLLPGTVLSPLMKFFSRVLYLLDSEALHAFRRLDTVNGVLYMLPQHSYVVWSRGKHKAPSLVESRQSRFALQDNANFGGQRYRKPTPNPTLFF